MSNRDKNWSYFYVNTLLKQKSLRIIYIFKHVFSLNNTLNLHLIYGKVLSFKRLVKILRKILPKRFSKFYDYFFMKMTYRGYYKQERIIL